MAFYSKLFCMEPCQKGTHSSGKLLHEPELRHVKILLTFSQFLEKDCEDVTENLQSGFLLLVFCGVVCFFFFILSFMQHLVSSS